MSVAGAVSAGLEWLKSDASAGGSEDARVYVHAPLLEVRTPPPSASEDAPRPVWTLPCESGSASAGVDAPSPGENALAISMAWPGGSALVRSQPALRQGPFCPCLLGVRARLLGDPQVCRPSPARCRASRCGHR